MTNPPYIGVRRRSGPRPVRARSLVSLALQPRVLLALSLSLSLGAAAHAQPGPPRPPQAGPRPGGVGPAATPAAVPATGPVMRLTATRGEVLRRHAGGPAEPVSGALPLLLMRTDEISVRSGAAELSLESGMAILVPEGSAVSILGTSSVTLLRGELQVVPKPGKEPRPLYVAGPPGSFPLKVRDALVRLDGDALVVMVYDGVARPGSPTISWGPAVNTGQGARWAKGAPPPTAKPLLPAPTWSTTSELFLQGLTPLPISTRWQPVNGALRYRVEVLRSDGDNPPIVVSTSEVMGPRTTMELRGIDPGSYLTRVSAIDDLGAIGVASVPRQLLVAQVANLEADGVVRLEAGSQPQVTAPPGQLATVLVDGESAAVSGPAPGTHRLRVVVGGLSAEAPLVVQAKSPLPGEPVSPPEAPVVPERPVVKAPEPERPHPARPPLPLPVTTPPPLRVTLPPPPAPIPAPAAGPGDMLLGGVGEVPFDGIRSPWAGRLATVRFESTLSGAARLAVTGRLVMDNGFGIDLSASVLRTAFADVPPGTTATGFGNVSAAVRSPALRKGRFALQALVATVAPLSSSVLDAGAEVDPSTNADGTNFRANVRPSGGGWRVEPAVLLGIRFGQFALVTTQGASLRVTPDLGPSYAGGLLLHADVLPMLRFMTFAQWQVGYLGVPLADGDRLPDVGGAAGAGFEVLLPAGKPGQLRLGLLGRAGIGSGGAAIYGRGTLGMQVGYQFR